MVLIQNKKKNTYPHTFKGILTDEFADDELFDDELVNDELANALFGMQA